MGKYSQKNRMMQFQCAGLDPDELLIQSIRGTEGMSQLFDFELELLREVKNERDGKTLDIVSKKATLVRRFTNPRFQAGSWGERHFHGMIASVGKEYWSTDFVMYRVRFVPELWQLTLNHDCRIFESKSVIQIIKDVVRSYGIQVTDKTHLFGDTNRRTQDGELTNRQEGAGTVLDYCTQYNESDFAFISRLAERWGLYYYFEQSEQVAEPTAVVFGDSADGYYASDFSLEYAPSSSTVPNSPAMIDELRTTTAMTAGKYSRSDYSYISSGQWDTDLSSANPLINRGGGENAFHHFRYSNRGFSSRKKLAVSAGENLEERSTTDKLLEVEKAASDISIQLVHGKTNSLSLFAGSILEFALVDNEADDDSVSYVAMMGVPQKLVLLQLTHDGVQYPPYVNVADAAAEEYQLTFTAMDSRLAFVPPANTPEPSIAGPQSAIVLANEGEEVTVDKRGRVRIQFMWQRIDHYHTTAAETETAWVRVAQQWAGFHRGTFFWPRRGDEVLVQFIQGDPDDPVIVGSVYNRDSEPYQLPNEKPLVNGMVGRSVPSTYEDDHNNLVAMGDAAGQEMLYLQAKRNMQTLVFNDNLRHIWGNELGQIDGSQSTTVSKAQSLSVGGSQTINVGGPQTTVVRGNVESTVCGTHKEFINGDVHRRYKADVREKIDGDVSRQIAGSLDERLGAVHQETLSTTHRSGHVVYIEAANAIYLGVRGNYIQIDPTGIQIQGTNVLINTPGVMSMNMSPGPFAGTNDPELPVTQCGEPEPDDVEREELQFRPMPTDSLPAELQPTAKPTVGTDDNTPDSDAPSVAPYSPEGYKG